MEALKKAVLRTLAYADIFDYPLKKEEIKRWLIAESHFGDERKIGAALGQLLEKGQCQLKAGYFFLPGRGETVSLRRRRTKASIPKLKKAEKVARLLKWLPWIKLIGITGALAKENANQEDDIDLFFVTAKGRLWLTRGLIVTCLRFSHLYRRPNKVKDRICPNMFLDEGHLRVPQEEQDLFAAHELCQLRLIWAKDKSYQKLLRENQWVQQFLPNWRP